MHLQVMRLKWVFRFVIVIKMKLLEFSLRIKLRLMRFCNQSTFIRSGKKLYNFYNNFPISIQKAYSLYVYSMVGKQICYISLLIRSWLIHIRIYIVIINFFEKFSLWAIFYGSVTIYEKFFVQFTDDQWSTYFNSIHVLWIECASKYVLSYQS